MKQKGFTLVEVLAVIIILGIIVTVVYPAVVSTIRNSEEKAYNSQIEIIKKAARVYALEKESRHASVLPELTEGASNTILISSLINEGYIADEELQNEGNKELKENGEIVNPKDETKCNRVQIKYESNQYTYTVVNVIEESVVNTCTAIK